MDGNSKEKVIFLKEEFADGEGKFKYSKGKFSVSSGHHIIGEFKGHEPWNTTEYDKNSVIVGKVVDGVQTIENSSQITPKLEVDVSI